MSRTELRVSLSDSKLDGDSSENKKREFVTKAIDKTTTGQKKFILGAYHPKAPRQSEEGEK